VSTCAGDAVGRREFRARRWLSVTLRTLHLMAVIVLGAVVLGTTPLPGWSPPWVAGAVVVSGLAMLTLDLYVDRLHLRTVAGLAALGKVGLVVVLALWPGPFTFWTVVVLSSVVSHAPAVFRHRVLIPLKGRPPHR